MTNKQIASIVLNNKLKGLIIGHDDIIFYSESNLSESRCNEVLDIICTLIDKMRQPLVTTINKTKNSTS